MSRWSTNLNTGPDPFGDPEPFYYHATRQIDGAARHVRSYVSYDTRWPWWKRKTARLIERAHYLLDGPGGRP